MSEVGKAWEEGSETIGAGMSKGVVERWERWFEGEKNRMS